MADKYSQVIYKEFLMFTKFGSWQEIIICILNVMLQIQILRLIICILTESEQFSSEL